MRTFRFSLQPALDAAVHREHAAMLGLERANAACDLARAELAAIDRHSTVTRTSIDGRSGTRHGGRAWIAVDWELDRLRRSRVRRSRELEAAIDRALAAREGFEASRKATVALSLLRERRLADYRSSLSMYEEAEIDESNGSSRNLRIIGEASAESCLNETS